MKAGWETIALRDFCSIARGGSPRPIKQFLTNDPNGINWIKIGDSVQGGRYIDSTEDRIKPEGVSRSRYVKAGSFLLSNSMSFGRPYILRTNGCIHDGWLVLEPDYARVDQDFLYHVLGSRTVFDQFDRLAAGSTVRNLNIGLVEGVRIPLPPLVEQQRIVAVLDEAFDGLTRARAHAEANLQNARELFTSGVDSLLAENSKSWNTGTISDLIGPVATGPFGSILHKSDYVENCTPIVNPANIVDGRIVADLRKTIGPDKAKLLSSYTLRRGDIIIGRRGEMGRCAIVEEEQDGWLCGTGSFFIRPTQNIVPAFVAHVLRSPAYIAKLEAASTGATMANLSNKVVGNLVISVPQPSVQADYLSKIDDLQQTTDDLAKEYSAKLQSLDALRQSLLQKAFAGELT